MRKLRWILFLLPLLFACVKSDTGTFDSDLERIKSRDTLCVVTLSRSTTYFDYQGKEMGYEFEMAQRLAEYLGVNLKMVTARDVDEMVKMLDNKDVDVIAYPVTISNEMKEKVDFLDPVYRTKQVLVQQRRKKKKLDVTEAMDLTGKEVYVVENSKYHKHLVSLDDEIGGGIQIQLVSNEEDEESLIEKVSKGEIEYTVADNTIAKLNKTYYDNIDVSVVLSHSQKSAWVVRSGADDLKIEINNWFSKIQGDFTYQYLYHKYFEKQKNYSKKNPKYIDKKTISKFDPLFKKYSPIISWDWKLLASMAYQESRFNPDAKSWAGAMGLMQVLPSTGVRYGVDSLGLSIPDQNVKAAAKYLRKVDGMFGYIEDKDERTKFVLASYNAGVGHIRDAMALAEKHGRNPDKWSDVRTFVLMKSKPEFFNDPIVRHGYLRGEETDRFVSEIMVRYKEYDEMIID